VPVPVNVVKFTLAEVIYTTLTAAKWQCHCTTRQELRKHKPISRQL